MKIFSFILALCLSWSLFAAEFSTKGDPKAQGLDIRMKYDASWSLENGRRPHILKLVSRDVGDVRLSVILGVFKNKSNLLQKLLAIPALTKEDVARSGLSSDGEILEIEKTRLDGEPALAVMCAALTKRSNFQILTVTQTFYVDFKGLLINISIGATIWKTQEITDKDAEHLEKVFKDYHKEMSAIVLSTVFMDKWKNK